MTESRAGLDVAVIGMSGRFPGAPDLETFWVNLRDGLESIRTFSPGELAAAGVPARLRSDPRYVPAGGVLDDVRSVDAAFFDLTPRDAALLDPQQRLLLECAWEALEQAGYATGGPSADVVAAFVSVGFPQYLVTNLLPSGVLQADGRRNAAIWNDKDHAATRLAYKLGLTGPAVTVQSACSSSLVAVHLAVQALVAGECDIALAGGMTVRLPEHAGYLPVEGGPESPGGHCRAFDAAADGLVPGSGGGIVALRRLDDAAAAGDRVLAVIRGSAVTNDGADKVGYTAPGVHGQARAIRAAQQVAGVSADEISYIEAHGTGTRLGDPIEIAALTAVFGSCTGRGAPCLIGSVKTNIGHLDVGAGIAGFIKTVLALQHRQIPPSLHFMEPNPEIGFAASPFEVVTSLRDWPAVVGPRRAAVSSFGIGGTNAHVVLEEAAPPQPAGPATGPHLIVLSARSGTALRAASSRLADHLAAHRPALADVAYTTQVGRRAFAHRQAVVAADLDDAVAALRAEPARLEMVSGAPAVAFLFPGQGTPRMGLGAQMYRAQRVFRASFEECADLARPQLGSDLRDLLLSAAGSPREAGRPGRTAEAQTALFVIEYALARQWLAWGVRPDVLLGHSLGEYLAACLAGVFSTAEALRLVIRRAQLMQDLPAGAMLAVPLPAEELDDVPAAGLTLAVINGPRQCVVSGPRDAVGEYRRRLADRRVPTRLLDTSHAFHSAMMDPILNEFRAAVADVPRRAPRLRVLSSVTGQWLTDTEAVDPDYWVRHLREPVRFADAVTVLTGSGPLVCVELAAEATLGRLVRRTERGAVAVAALGGAGDEPARSLASLGRVWAAGVPVDWTALHDGRRRRVTLPTYPFERTECWVDAGPATQRPVVSADGLRKRGGPGSWSSLSYWRPAGRPPGARAGQDEAAWFVVAPDEPAAAAVVNRLAGQGSVLRAVRPGADYRTELARLPRWPDRFLYWAAQRPWRDVATAAADCFTDLMRLAQELAGHPGSGRLDVVTTGAQPVGPAGTADLGHTPLLGIVRVFPQECPQVTCGGIDVPATCEPADVDAVVAELRKPGMESGTTIAIRHGIRWEPEYTTLDLPAVAEGGLRDGGTYLITGGLGSVGLTVAAHLARTCRANLVLTGRQPVPEPQTWRGLVAGGPAETMFGDLAATVDQIAGLDHAPPALPDRTRQARTLADRLSAQYVYALLTAAGIDTTGTIGERAIAERLGAIPVYRRFVHGMLTLLAEDGIVGLGAGTVTFRRAPAEVGDPVRTDALIRRDYPEFAPVLDVLERCVEAIPGVLAGKRDPVGVLFPDGDSTMFDRMNRLIGEHSDQAYYLGILRDAVHDLAAGVGQPVRILEIGAGKGRLTELLAAAVADLDVEYRVTDVSAGFVTGLRERFNGQGMTFGTLDISRDPAEQGYPLATADLVVGFNVVHAAPDVARAIGHLHGLLRPGGLLCLSEAVADEPWGRLIWGLTREWWSFTDLGLRSRSPLLPIDDWLGVLSGAGFGTVRALPADVGRRATCDTTLLFAQRSATGPVSERIRVLQGLADEGISVMARSADVTDPVAMRAVVEEAEQRFGHINGVLHLAYVPGGPLLALRSPADVVTEFAPKITGTLVLDDLFRDRELDFMMLFSSLTALTGGYGAAAYAGAGAFVDRFPAAVRRSYPVISVNWPLWRGLDTPYATDLRRRMLPAGADDAGLTPAEGLDVLSRILASRPAPNVVVSPTDLKAILDLARTWRPAVAPAAVLGSGPAGSTSSAAEQHVAAIWRQVLGIEDVPLEADFAALGGDSLTAMQIVARLRDALGQDLPLRDFLADATVAGVARWVAAQAGVGTTETGETDCAPPGRAAEPGVPPRDPAMTVLLAEIEGMPDDEVRAALVAERTPTGSDQS